MLAENIVVQREFRLEASESGGIGVEDKVHVVTGVEFAGDIAEVALIHFLDGFNRGALGGELLFEAFDGFLRAVFLAPEIEDDESFVTVFHDDEVVFGLN